MEKYVTATRQAKTARRRSAAASRELLTSCQRPWGPAASHGEPRDASETAGSVLDERGICSTGKGKWMPHILCARDSFIWVLCVTPALYVEMMLFPVRPTTPVVTSHIHTLFSPRSGRLIPWSPFLPWKLSSRLVLAAAWWLPPACLHCCSFDSEAARGF